MNPYRRAALFLIRMVAISLIFFGGTLFCLGSVEKKLSPRSAKVVRVDPAQSEKAGRHADSRSGSIRWAVRSLPWIMVIVGVPLLVRSSALARRLTEDLDDEEPPSET